MKAGSTIRGRLDLTGDKKLIAALTRLERKTLNKHLRKAIRAGAKPIQQEAKDRAPVETGQVRDNIKIRAAKKLRRGSVGIVVQTSEGFFQGEDFYASFHEFGYFKQQTIRAPDGTLRSMRRGRGEPVWIPPNPFMQPAFDAARSTAEQIIRSTLAKLITQDAKK